MSNLLEAKNVNKNFGDFTALDNINISIPEGSIFGLLGPNGAGKTTFIRIINQITYPDKGEILLQGKRLSPNDVSKIGYLPEERGLYKSMKVGEQAMYLARLKGMSKQEAKTKLNYWFDRLEIGDWWGKKIQELSKGMAQKIQFIVTVLHEPKLLIFDEPFSGFDPINANLIKREILNLRNNGATVIFSTHRMESVEELCDHIALIHKSKKILDGRLTDIKRAYKNSTYEIALETANKDALFHDLSSKFKVSSAKFKTLGDELKVNIQLQNGTSSKELISYLNTTAEITHFVEVIPSANDIFIETINTNGQQQQAFTNN
ncbi:ABC transporter ATP-binding protein [Ascidiimonas sp. W6]|uniref:ABC transporter ATP-binding protein n=1 Tax=Ascidiimonas meishanensis TaxID=3128903 RepID=UPI0030EE7545